MKFLIHMTFIASLAMVLGACNKTKSTGDNMSPLTGLTGKWELRQLVGNIGTRNYAPGNGSVVEFTASTYSTVSPKDDVYFEGYGDSHGTYKVVADGSVNVTTGLGFAAGQFANRIIFNDNDSTEKVFYQITGDKLTVVAGYFPTDGGSQKTYQRQ